MRVLLHSHPFHGHVAAGWRARPDPAVETMGVCWACGGVQLVWSPAFVDRISEPELAGVLLHEVHHVVLRHPFLFPEQADPGPTFDLRAAIVAEEITVNEFVTLPLPGEPLRLEQFAKRHPQLAALQSTRERYRLLYDADRARRDHDEREQFKKTVVDQVRRILAALHGDGAGQLPDNHAGWESFRRAGAAAALAVSVATAQAFDRHGASLAPELRRLIEAAHASNPDILGGAPGTTSGGLLETLAGTARSRLSWQRILRRLLAVDHEAEPTYLRPPRRFPDLVGMLPGSRRVATIYRILAAIDTSGSMSSATLDAIAAELRVMARSYDVSVVEFDFTIQRRYRLGGLHSAGAGAIAGSSDPLAAMQGRGGTNFFPVFEPDTLAWAADGGALSGIVVFTDGFGPAPESPPSGIPPNHVIWILMGGPAGMESSVRVPASWGSVVDTTAGRRPAVAEPTLHMG